MGFGAFQEALYAQAVYGRHRPVPALGGRVRRYPSRPLHPSWDCSDWQAFAHADRTIAILESLAENRGKTLYCGVDQSDTFSKAETWAAGKDRNERDDTIYSGERGIFRGFIAAQEGWLTEGESGVIGVSIAHIFEFPKEERKRRRKKKEYLRNVVLAPPNSWVWYYGPEASGASFTAAATAARAAFNAIEPITVEEMIRYVRYDTDTFKARLTSDAERTRYAVADTRYYHGNINNSHNGLDALCRSLGYQRATNIEPNLTATFSSIYANRQDGATYYAAARKGISFPGRSVDCVRVVRR